MPETVQPPPRAVRVVPGAVPGLPKTCEVRMASFHFIDREGTGWTILAGLPADFPDGGAEHGPFAGLTFRANTGEVRVLPRAAIPRRASTEIPVRPLGTRSRVRELEPTEWEELLRHAVVWPSA